MGSTEDAREAEIDKFMEQHRWRYWPGVVAGAFVDALFWGQARQKASVAIERWIFGQPLDDLIEKSTSP